MPKYTMPSFSMGKVKKWLYCPVTMVLLIRLQYFGRIALFINALICNNIDHLIYLMFSIWIGGCYHHQSG
jgi:hypothetical protein